MAAQSAIDIALWDIKGKALDQPVHMLLGGRMRDKVVCYTGIGGATPADSASSAVTCVEEGWKYLRFSVNDRDGVLEPRTAVRDAIDHFAAIREAVGPDIEICIDVHTRLDPPDSIRLGRELEQSDPFFIEDLFPVQVPYFAGYLLPPDRPGLGVEFDESAAENYSFKWLSGPQLRREDGSFTNW